MTELRTHTLIVGAGMTGLAFADAMQKKGFEYLVAEADQEPGGYCKTVIQDGFVWDYSGHFFHFRRPEIEKELVSRMTGEVRRIERRSRIFWKGELIDFPFQKNIHQLPKQDFIDCVYDLVFREEGEPKNFEEMLVHKFGRSIADMFLIPYNEKLYATSLTNLDVDAMGRFFPHADLEAIVRNFRAADNRSYNATFTYPEGGAIQYIHAMMEGVDEQRVLYGSKVAEVDVGNRLATLQDGRAIRYERLVSTMPFSKLLAATGQQAHPALTWNKVLVFNLGFDKPSAGDAHWVYFPQRDLPFYRVGFYDNIFGTDRMSLYVELGYPHDADLPGEAHSEIREQVVTALKQVGIVDGHKLVSHHSVVLDPAYVHISGESNALVEQIKAGWASEGLYSIGRYGSWTYCSIEDNIIEARDLSEHW